MLSDSMWRNLQNQLVLLHKIPRTQKFYSPDLLQEGDGNLVLMVLNLSFQMLNNFLLIILKLVKFLGIHQLASLSNLTLFAIKIYKS